LLVLAHEIYKNYGHRSNTLNYNNAVFVKSANLLSQLPPESHAEIAIAGRSNAGKSSALNSITNKRSLARTSKTPGRTQLLNYFQIADHNFLVDLPGYGYAKVPAEIQAHWEKTLSEYIETRQELCGIVLIMDIRHPLKPFDQQMISWVTSVNLPIHILLTKADKLKRGAAINTLLQVQKTLASYGELVTVQLFSALTPQGVDEARAKLDSWFTS
jgi:GTP-binding protein